MIPCIPMEWNIMTGGASVEETLSLLVTGLRTVKEKMRPLFGQARVAASAEHYLETLLGNLPRKTGWQRAEAAGDEGPWRQQALLGRTQTACVTLSAIMFRKLWAMRTLSL